MPDRPAIPPWLGVAIAVASVSFAAPLFRLADAPPLTASFWRLTIAVVCLVPFTGSSWRAWKAYTSQEWLVVLGTGAALALHFALWVTSLQMTTVAAATVLVTLQAIFVAFGGHFLLGDRLRLANWAGVIMAIVGGGVIAYGDHLNTVAAAHPHALLGDFLALAAGLGSAAYMLVGRRLRANRGLIEYVTPVYAAAAVILGLAASLFEQPLVAGLGSSNFLYFVLLAAVPMLGGHTVSNWVLKHLPAHIVATWILLEPVGAALVARFHPAILESPSAWTMAGGVVVLAGAAMTIPRRGPKSLAIEVAG